MSLHAIVLRMELQFYKTDFSFPTNEEEVIHVSFTFHKYPNCGAKPQAKSLTPPFPMSS